METESCAQLARIKGFAKSHVLTGPKREALYIRDNSTYGGGPATKQQSRGMFLDKQTSLSLLSFMYGMFP